MPTTTSTLRPLPPDPKQAHFVTERALSGPLGPLFSGEIMSDELTIIVGKSYAHGMTWLRQNAKKYKLDPQKCRITNNAHTFKGLKDYTVIWLRGWAACVGSAAIRHEANVARSLGRIKGEISP